MRRAATMWFLTAVIAAAVSPAAAQECPGNPNALGVSRTIVVDPADHALLGSFQYGETLPLAEKEVVLTFDDGPLPPYSSRILDILASECVKATFFMVGRQVRGYPQIVRRAYNEGHTIANHSQNHPFTFNRMTVDQAAVEIEQGFESLRAALGDPAAVAPFFRIPGLLRQSSVETYLTQRDIMVWSVDFLADDWRHIRAQEVVRRAISRIEARGRGILLLHDIQPATALGLPELLKELKARGYRIVHVVPAGPDRPKTVTEPDQWATRQAPKGYWPRVLPVGQDTAEPALGTPSPQNFGVADVPGANVPVDLAPTAERPWPQGMTFSMTVTGESTPAPSANNFRYARFWKPPGAGSERHSFKPRRAKAKTDTTSSVASTTSTTGSGLAALLGRKKPPEASKPATRAASAKPTAKPADRTAQSKDKAKPVNHTAGSKEADKPPVRTRPIGHQLTVPRPTASLTQPKI